MKNFLDSITKIINDLNQAGFNKDANDLQELATLALDENLSRDIRKDALKQTDSRCHVKWLGDYYLPHLSQKDWWDSLEKLSKSTKKYAFNLN